jgi:hypothetical protein
MDVRSLYPMLDVFDLCDYGPMIDAMGIILVQSEDGSSQGDTRVLLEKDGKFGYLCFGWGSCSGCDALQACSNWDDVQELYDSLASQVKWFDGAREALEWFKTHDWESDYSRDETFIRECLILLEEHSETCGCGNEESEQLRMYVWEDVLSGYTPGLVCVLAASEDQALRLVRAKDESAFRRIEGLKPRVTETPEAFLVWGRS